jgi:hypothetical protein
VPHGVHWRILESFKFPLSVAFQGKPGKKTQSSHKRTDSDNEAGQDTRVLRSSWNDSVSQENDKRDVSKVAHMGPGLAFVGRGESVPVPMGDW